MDDETVFEAPVDPEMKRSFRSARERLTLYDMPNIWIVWHEWGWVTRPPDEEVPTSDEPPESE